MAELTQELCRELKSAAGKPLRVLDPETNEEYVLLTAEAFDRLSSLLQDQLFSQREKQFLIQEFGRRAGWDDPELDVYEEYRLPK